jgi:PAS domain S-box-containing protein
MNLTEKDNILIVDDRPANVLALDALLSSAGRVLIAATSGREALEILKKQKVDLIILDVQMPDMNGFELAQLLKAERSTAEIPIIFASAEKLDRASRMKGFEGGAIDYLLKPLDPDITKAKVAVLLELQKRKRQLIEKNQALEKSALLINNSADIIGVLDAHTLLVEEMNPSFTSLLGYANDKVKNKSLYWFLEEGDARRIRELAVSSTERLSFEARLYADDGSLKWLEWNVVVRQGKWFVNARDITEIRQLNTTLQKSVQQLEAANRELETFSYSVSHDLRAPLRAINGNVHALQEDYGNTLDETAKKYLRRIGDNAVRMNTLINDLLAFSRIGKQPVKRSRVDVEALVRQVVAEFSESHAHRATITIHPMPEAVADFALLKVVWTNLISNAIKYSSRKESPCVEIGGVASAGEVEYYIRDNGAGFDMAYADKLFGTFQRLHDASEFEGVGIGLAIVQRIVSKHGGAIRAEARKDHGAMFVFSIPPEG